MKLLYITSLSGKRINGFMRSAIYAAKNVGLEFCMVCNMDGADKEGYAQDCVDYGISVKHIPFERNPLSSKNKAAYKELLQYMRDCNFDIVHCNTPVGGLLGRLAARKAGVKKVIYQAHGFHFWKGAPIKNWLLYYPVEKLLAHHTDTLITINSEDYAFAQKKLKAKKVVYIPGVGIDLERFGACQVDKEIKRREIGVPKGSTWILSVGELIPRKNYESLIRAMVGLPNVYLTIAGRGEQTDYLQRLIIELNLQEKVKLLGFRSDISELCEAADIFAFPTYQEGLPIAVMEAMACAKPIVCSAVRGNIDLIDSEGGELFDPHDVADIKNAIERVIKRDWAKLGTHNEKTIRKFDVGQIVEQMVEMYSSEISGGGIIEYRK